MAYIYKIVNNINNKVYIGKLLMVINGNTYRELVYLVKPRSPTPKSSDRSRGSLPHF